MAKIDLLQLQSLNQEMIKLCSLYEKQKRYYLEMDLVELELDVIHFHHLNKHNVNTLDCKLLQR